VTAIRLDEQRRYPGSGHRRKKMMETALFIEDNKKLFPWRFGKHTGFIPGSPW
jgi:hypothetical protein